MRGVWFGALSGLVSMIAAQWLADRLGTVDPAVALGGTARALVITSAVGAGIGQVLHRILRSAHPAIALVFACVLCPAAVLCADVWLLGGALPLVPALVGALVYALALAALCLARPALGLTET